MGSSFVRPPPPPPSSSHSPRPPSLIHSLAMIISPSPSCLVQCYLNPSRVSCSTGCELSTVKKKRVKEGGGLDLHARSSRPSEGGGMRGEKGIRKARETQASNSDTTFLGLAVAAAAVAAAAADQDSGLAGAGAAAFLLPLLLLPL